MDSGGEPSPSEGGLAPATGGGRRNKRRSSILKMPVTRGVLQVDLTIFRESLSEEILICEPFLDL